MTATMQARTTVIAAANPIGGRYKRALTLQENVKMSPALLSRFDLIFPMLDDADEAGHQQLSEHVMGVHCPGVHSCRRACRPAACAQMYVLRVVAQPVAC